MLKQGENISGYRVERQLFEHATSSAFLVVSTDGEATRLLVDNSSIQWNRTRRKQFQDQVKVLRETATPGTCRPFDAVEHQGLSGCLYPVPSGDSLSSADSDSLTVRSALELIRDVASCLDAPHELGQIHGNLSLETVYTQDDSFSCLADFALWSLIPLDYQTGILPLFTSPEQIRGEDPGTTSDIYSLGCLFYYLLTKKPPYAGEDAFTTGLMHLDGIFPELPEPLRLFDPLIKQMVSKERLTAGQVRDEAARLLQEDAVDQLVLPLQEETTQASVPDEALAAPIITSVTSATDDMIARIEERLQRLPEMIEEQDDSSPQTDDLTSALQAAEEETGISTAALPQAKKTKPSSVLKIAMLGAGLVLGLGIGFLFFGQGALSPGQEPTLSASVPSPAPEPQQPDLSTFMRHWQLSEYALAQQELNRLIDEFPNDYRLYNNLAALQATKGELDQARESLEKAVLLEPEFAVLYNNLSTVYTEIARDSYGRALQMDTSVAALSLDLFNNSGIVNWSTQQQLVADTELPASVKEDDPDVRDVATDEVPPEIPATSTDAVEDTVEKSVAVVMTVPPVERVIDEPVTKNVIDPEPVAVEREAPATVLQRWAAAWSTQDVEEYLSFYAPDFDPGSGLSRAAWESQRRQRLTRPENIEVTLSDFQVRNLSPDNVEVEVIQGYRSDHYADRTRKLFVLTAEGESWMIEREESLEVIR